MSSFGSSGGGMAKNDETPSISRLWFPSSRKCIQGKIYNSCSGILSNARKSPGNLKFFAITSLGTWASQSVSKNVESSENDPLSKMRINSAPSGEVSFAWMECGWPAGKYQRSPAD